MTKPRTPEGRVSAVANGATINGTYGLPPGEALDAFRADLKELVDRPTNDAFMSANRALHWRAAELRHHGIEPVVLPTDCAHYPPEGHDFGTRPVRGELAAIEGRQIVVRVPIEAIPHAACYALDECRVEVSDLDAAAVSLTRYLNREDEQGNTVLHFALDKALREAVEQGEDGFTDAPEPAHA